nr:C-type lectin mannose-binding isoform-like [Pogona vitticeps]
MARRTFFSLSLSGLLIISYYLQGAKAANCREGWLQYQQYCFVVIPTKMPWPEAEAECQNYGRGSHLASFDSELQMNVVGKHILAEYPDTDDLWIGMEDSRKTRRFAWNDGSPVRFTSWCAGEPNNQGGNEYCVHTKASSGFTKWMDGNCKIEKSALCKARLR